MAQKVENTVKLEIVTPYKKFFEGDVTSVVITTIDGQMGFMAGHPSLIVALSPGMSHLVQNGETKYFVLSEGYCEVAGNLIKITCNAAEYPEDLSPRRTCISYTEACEELEKAKGKVFLESKLEDVPPLEAKKLREKFEGCKECDVKENFDKVLEEIRDGVEKEQAIPTDGKEPTTLESEINSILETPEEGKTEDGGEVPGDVPQNALPMDVPKGIDEDGDEVYETEVDLYESSGEFDTIDQKAMDYFITKLENSYKFAR